MRNTSQNGVELIAFLTQRGKTPAYLLIVQMTGVRGGSPKLEVNKWPRFLLDRGTSNFEPDPSEGDAARRCERSSLLRLELRPASAVCC
jgi:hypothetical protein